MKSLLDSSKAALLYCKGQHNELLPKIVSDLEKAIEEYERVSRNISCGACVYVEALFGDDPCKECLKSVSFINFEERL